MTKNEFYDQALLLVVSKLDMSVSTEVHYAGRLVAELMKVRDEWYGGEGPEENPDGGQE